MFQSAELVARTIIIRGDMLNNEICNSYMWGIVGLTSAVLLKRKYKNIYIIEKNPVVEWK